MSSLGGAAVSREENPVGKKSIIKSYIVYIKRESKVQRHRKAAASQMNHKGQDVFSKRDNQFGLTLIRKGLGGGGAVSKGLHD